MANITVTADVHAILSAADNSAIITALGVDAAGTDNSTDVTIAGAGSYVSAVGQSITVDALTVSDVTDFDAEVTSNVSVAANTAKTGISAGQSSAITANTAKTGITAGQASAISANTAKTGITSGQASEITANTAKAANATHTGDVTGDTALTIAAGAVDLAMLSATGTQSSATFLRGDNTFAVASSDGLNGRIIVTEAADFGTIDSTKEYFLDGIIDMGTTSIEVPADGIYISGYNFDTSGIVSSEDNYSMFTSPTGGSGNVLFRDFHIETSGTNSDVYQLHSTNGFKAIEVARINYNNCTRLGDMDNYRQGLETGTGRFGGSASLTLTGTWVGGFRVTTSIVRAMSDTTTEPLFKAGVGFTMGSRFLTDMNCDLGDNQALLDFAPANFNNPSTLQLKGCIITRGGVTNSSDTNLTPNIAQSDLESDWDNNQGLHNTFVGGRLNCITEVQTVINSQNTFVGLDGTFETKSLHHFDEPAEGRLRHLGKDPIEFQLVSDFALECSANREIALRVVRFRASDSTDVPFAEHVRQVNNFVGGRDIAYFNITTNVTMEQNDTIRFQVANTTDTNNITLEENSYFIINER